MDEQDVEDVTAAATRFQRAIGDDFNWEWDARFKGALTQFEKSNEPFILDALREIFEHEWNVTNIENAPEAVLIAADFLGGLRSGQRLFSTIPNAQEVCVAAYWPWGNGTTISIRLVLYDPASTPSQNEQRVASFKEMLQL